MLIQEAFAADGFFMLSMWVCAALVWVDCVLSGFDEEALNYHSSECQVSDSQDTY